MTWTLSQLALFSALRADPSCAGALLGSGTPVEVERAALMIGDVDTPTRARYAARGGQLGTAAVVGSRDAAWLATLGPGAKVAVRRGLARNPLTDTGTASALTADEDPTVAAYAVANPNADTAAVRTRLASHLGLGVFARDPDRAAFAATVLNAHPGLVDLFAAHPSSSFRRIAARQSNLAEADVVAMFASSRAGDQAFRVNPRVPAMATPPRWWRASHAGAAAAVLTDTGELRADVSCVEGVQVGSPSVDVAVMRALAVRGLSDPGSDLAGILAAFSCRAAGTSSEPDIVGALLDLCDGPCSMRVARSLSGSRMAGALRASVWADAATVLLDASMRSYTHLYSPDSSIRARGADFDAAITAGASLPALLGKEPGAWRVYASAAGSWTGTPTELAHTCADATHVTMPASGPAAGPRAIRVPGRREPGAPARTR